MDLSSLTPAEGSVKTKKRIGRGQGSGRGGTSTRGHKGQKSRSGYSKKIGFEGGQMPLQRRVPKYGFRNINRISYKAVNLAVLQELYDANPCEEINLDTFINAGLISKRDNVKVLSMGEFTAKVKVVAHGFSKAAVEAIEKAGGTVEVVEVKNK